MSERYPLWCVDRGASLDESQYAGPFDTEDEANDARGQYGGGDIRRCRRVLASESGAHGYVFDNMHIQLDEIVLGGDLSHRVPDAWGNWEDQMVHARDGAAEAFREFIDKWMRVDAYVCEGDEPAQEGGAQ
jgi:hypothetical protein